MDKEKFWEELSLPPLHERNCHNCARKTNDNSASCGLFNISVDKWAACAVYALHSPKERKTDGIFPLYWIPRRPRKTD